MIKHIWKQPPLDQWSIISMHHYYVNGVKHLSVIMMAKGDKYIKEEGLDDEYLWNRLWHKAVEMDKDK
jgi:hypothetical protein